MNKFTTMSRPRLTSTTLEEPVIPILLPFELSNEEKKTKNLFENSAKEILNSYLEHLKKEKEIEILGKEVLHTMIWTGNDLHDIAYNAACNDPNFEIYMDSSHFTLKSDEVNKMNDVLERCVENGQDKGVFKLHQKILDVISKDEKNIKVAVYKFVFGKQVLKDKILFSVIKDLRLK